jgi:hypothetical protein
MSTKTRTIQAIDAINLSKIPNVNNNKIVLKKGKYAVTFTSNMCYAGNLGPLDQIMIFSTTPLNSDDSEKWYFAPVKSQGTYVRSDGSNPIYVFVVDQVNSYDNTGAAIVTFTEV